MGMLGMPSRCFLVSISIVRKTSFNPCLCYANQLPENRTPPSAIQPKQLEVAVTSSRCAYYTSSCRMIIRNVALIASCPNNWLTSHSASCTLRCLQHIKHKCVLQVRCEILQYHGLFPFKSSSFTRNPWLPLLPFTGILLNKEHSISTLGSKRKQVRQDCKIRVNLRVEEERLDKIE